MKFTYKKLDGYTYHIAVEPTKYLREWLEVEWKTDAVEHPDQPWTREWLESLKKLDFSLDVVNIVEIEPRPDLMAYEKGEYSFQKELSERVSERVGAIEMGASIMPLVIRDAGRELMDGYTRYAALSQLGATKVYAYIGHL